MKWNKDHTVTVTPPKRPKKCTGTRFAAVLGLNRWTTPFNAWCAITRTYEEPFVDTKYTIAGKTIEPKQAAYMREKYFWKRMISPTDAFGEDYFKRTWGDFFPENDIFGGMWDYLFADNTGEITAVMEMKTTKRVEDWVDDIPEYYAMQAALYAYLLGVDDVIMVCTVLEDKDYENPENFVVTPQNTFERPFKVSQRYPDFSKTITKVARWWKKHVLTGVSPIFDEKKDADILKALRANHLSPDTDISLLLVEAEQLKDKLDAAAEEVAADEKRLKLLKDRIKELCLEQFRDGDKQVVIKGSKYEWVTARSVTLKIDEEAMKKDGILDQYKTKETVSYRLTPKAL